MRQGKYKRVYLFLKRASRGFILSLKPNKIQGRFVGPRVLVNSIPKSGTHLVDQLLEEFPLVRPALCRTVREKPSDKLLDINFEERESIRVKKILSILKGQYMRAHMPLSKALSDGLSQAGNVKTILIVRDPRSVVVSQYKYISDIDVTHPTHDIINQYENISDKLRACILGVDGHIEAVVDVYRSYSAWLEREDTLVVKFEDLVGKNGGGDDATRKSKIYEIAHFLGIDINSNAYSAIVENIGSPNTSTYRSGNVHDWKNYLDGDLELVLKEEFSGLEVKFGYQL